jgi:hypothetical protein
MLEEIMMIIMFRSISQDYTRCMATWQAIHHIPKPWKKMNNGFHHLHLQLLKEILEFHNLIMWFQMFEELHLNQLKVYKCFTTQALNVYKCISHSNDT